MKKPKIYNNLKHHEGLSLMELHHRQIMVVYCSQSDAEIWKSFKQGEEAAFNYIYRKYIPALFNYGYQLCKDKSLVKDCIQTIFMDLRIKREKLPEVSNIKGYLFKIMYRDLMRSIKKSHAYEYESLDNSDSFFPIVISHETRMINEEHANLRKKELEEAMAKLPSRQRKALLLLYREELSYKEIANIMDFKDVKSARKLVYRALSSLRSLFKI
ncbi:RNA polymerase sigma factor [Echinicola sp. CAU 1574]|uniref:RNA polymerase sigma factor n=1 Tax=Echinicola arenosa TaxID=2774144 RepID=A0ABR9AIA9_9BACT|nr:RNA polymerase sigma factor [Echinicola arenosa]MBD8487354.1 RNA polymerase sigma factor [Echinicola arenosa]